MILALYVVRVVFKLWPKNGSSHFSLDTTDMLYETNFQHIYINKIIMSIFNNIKRKKKWILSVYFFLQISLVTRRNMNSSNYSVLWYKTGASSLSFSTVLKKSLVCYTFHLDNEEWNLSIIHYFKINVQIRV